MEEVIDHLDGAHGLPPSDLLVMRIAGGGSVLIRPSGTEPKLKAYLEQVVPAEELAAVPAARADANRLLADLRQGIETLLS